MKPTNELEVLRLIDALLCKKSSGFDNIDNTLLKELKYKLSTPLTILFNRSMNEGIFPNNMKLADVVTLYKSKEKYKTTYYRPISLLITISKIFEKIMYTRTYQFLNSTNQIFKSQYGFRSKHSC